MHAGKVDCLQQLLAKAEPEHVEHGDHVSLLCMQESLSAVHAGKIDSLQQLLAKAQLELDAVAGEASTARARLHSVQQEASAKASAAQAASASALQAQQVNKSVSECPALQDCASACRDTPDYSMIMC